MRSAIAIGILGVALSANGAAAQTASEQARILGDFRRNVTEYTERHRGLELFPEAINAATPAPRIFTLPITVVFRQLIDRALTERAGAALVGGVGATHHAAGLQPFPATELVDFPQLLANALPALPAPLEYRLIDRDLVVRDAHADVIVAVLRNAVGALPARR